MFEMILSQEYISVGKILSGYIFMGFMMLSVSTFYGMFQDFISWLHVIFEIILSQKHISVDINLTVCTLYRVFDDFMSCIQKVIPEVVLNDYTIIVRFPTVMELWVWKYSFCADVSILVWRRMAKYVTECYSYFYKHFPNQWITNNIVACWVGNTSNNLRFLI
jgi:hypothetical protein